MPCRYGCTPEHRVRIELVEADLEICFTLVDLAGYSPGESVRLLADAGRVYDEILARLKRLEPDEVSKFQPLVTELRRAIDLATRGS
uniref:Uncharacterized protein n=1 Tax=Solibacter usitatus (strain Ellin6076) TaxID=234267 RepID=Q01UE4_SOLUE